MANVFLNDLKLQKVWDAIRKNFYPVPPESGTAQPPTPAMEGDITIAFGRYTSGQYQGYLNSIVSTIGDGKVTTSKLADSAVTKAKLASGAIDPVVTWGNGTTAGPTITIQAGKDTSVPKAVPAATAEYSGIITTTTQTVSGNKTFKGNILGEQNIEALFGMSAHGHADLNIAAGGGAGTVTCISVNDAVKEPDGTGMITLDDYPTLTAYNADKTQINSAISQINSKIPIAATASNQLADKDFVNSSISTATATFRNTWTAADDTEAAAQTALANITTKDLNDYAFVKVENTPQTGIDKYKRYKYNGNNWLFEYALNNSSFTASQWDAINSTITSAKVADFNAKYKKPTTGIPATDLDSQTQTLLVLASTALQRVDFFNLGDHDTPVYFNAHGYGQVIDALSVPGNIESTGGGVAAHGHADLGVSAGGGSGTTTAVRIGNGSPIEAVDGVVTIPTTQISQQPDGTIALGGVAISVKGLGSFAYRSSINLAEVVGATDVVSSLSNAIGQTHAMAEDNSENIAEHDERITDLEMAFDGSSVKYAIDSDKVDGHHASEFVGALGVSGNNLTWTKIGGTAQNITVPYATNAGQLGGVALGGLFTLLANDNKQLSVTVGEENKKLTLDYAKQSTTLETEPLTNQEFIFRNSPKTIGADSLKLDRILGRTLVWNQSLNDSVLGAWSCGSFTKDGHTFTIVSNSQGNAYLGNGSVLTIGHKYLLLSKYKISDAGSFISFAGSPTAITADGNWHQFSLIVTATETTFRIGFQFNAVTAGKSGQFMNAQLVDLTLMFGSAIDGMTNAQILAMFEALYPNAYYDYNQGQLINNSAEGLETVGFNIWDEEWEANKRVNLSTGVIEPYNGTSISKNYIPILPGTGYYYQNGTWANKRIVFYDAGKNFISSLEEGSNGSFTTPANAAFMLFYWSGTTYKNDICINLSDPNRNGQYEPYKRNVLDLHLDNIQVKSPNIWDEEWIKGGDYSNNGSWRTDSHMFSSKNLIPIEPLTSYYHKFGAYGYIYYYDVNKNYISTYTTTAYSGGFSSPSNARYMHFSLYYSGGAPDYNNDICINESDPAFNGKYFPHGVLTFNGLKQAGSVRDEIVGGKYIKRVGSVDLGTLDWTKNRTSFESNDIVPKRTVGRSGASLLCCARYIPATIGWSDSPVRSTGQVYEYASKKAVAICDDAYSNYTEAQVKEALSGVMLNYVLATYETYELVSPIPTAMPAGTTERIISDRLPVAPFACDMTYGTNPGDILASGIAWEKIWGRPTIVHDKSNVSLTTLDRHVIKIGDKELYLIFSVGSDGTSYTLRVATGLNNGVYENEQVFNFATIDDTTINNICHL